MYNIVGDVMKVTIDRFDSYGRGITKVNEKICFVENALPHEECEIKILDEKKNYIEAESTNVIKESDYRILPICPYYNICGGCHLLHLDRKSELVFKEEKVSDLINKFSDIKMDVNDILYNNEYYYRNKLTLHVKENKVGLYKKNSNDLIEIDDCLICDHKINELIPKIKEYLNNNKSDLEEIVIKKSSLDEIMIIFKGKTDINSLKEYFKDIHSVYLNDKLILGKEYITERINDLEFYIRPDSFFQVNYEMMKTMYNKVIEYYQKNNNSNVLDLYCGTGTIGMLISKYVNKVTGVEVNSDSITSAKECAKKNNITNIDFILGKVEDNIDKFNDIDSIVVDPPRSGLDKHTIDSIININPNSIIYISCDPATLARDLKILKDNYNIKSITPLDMFPNTYHVENIVILERR